MFTSLFSDSDDLRRAFDLLSRNSLVEFQKEERFIRIDNETKTEVRKCLRDQNGEKAVLAVAIKLLSSNLTEVSNLHHAISVFEYLKEHSENTQMVEDAIGMASRVTLGLMDLSRYSKANAFGFDAFNFAKGTLGEHHSATLCVQHNLGTLLAAEGKFEQSLELLLPLYEKDLQFSTQREVVETLVTVARSLSESSRYSEALSYYERLLKNKRVSSTDDKTILTAFHDYALLLNDLDETQKALEILRDVMRKRNEVLSLGDDDTRLTKSSIAHVLLKQYKYREALGIFRNVYEERRIHLGDMHEDTLRTKRDLAVTLIYLNDYDEAIDLLNDVVKKFDRVLGEAHPDTLSARANLGIALSNHSHLEDAYHMLVDVYEKQREVLGEHQIETMRVKYNIASVLRKQGKCVEALRVLEEVFRGFRIVFGPNHPETLNILMEISTMRFHNLGVNESEAALLVK